MATPLAGASVDRGVWVEITWKHGEQRGKWGLPIHVLCVPSMHSIQKWFKHAVPGRPVYKMNIEEASDEEERCSSYILLAMKRTTRGQLREGDLPWEGRLWE